MSEVKIGMPYDGPVDNNPFKPRSGDVVAICPHEARPIHIQFVERQGRPTVGGISVRWVNCCQECKSVIERFVEMPPSKHRLFLDHLEKCTFCRCEPKGDLNGLRLLCEPGAALFKAFVDSIVSRPATAEDFLVMVRSGKVES